MPLAFGYGAHVRSHGHDDGSRTQLRANALIQPLPPPGPGREREETLHRHANQPVSLPTNDLQTYCRSGHYSNADVPRALVRDMYTKSWSAFDRLVAIVPPGGSIG